MSLNLFFENFSPSKYFYQLFKETQRATTRQGGSEGGISWEHRKDLQFCSWGTTSLLLFLNLAAGLQQNEQWLLLDKS
jgi:hypothetical protein